MLYISQRAGVCVVYSRDKIAQPHTKQSTNYRKKNVHLYKGS